MSRFWDRVEVGPRHSCWPWTGKKQASGHGRYYLRGFGEVGAHREAYRRTHGLKHGDIAAHVLHSCDNPPCCNPAHLFLGTHQENVQDMYSKGRGMRVPISREVIRQVRATRNGRGYSMAHIAEIYGISVGSVNNIVNREGRFAHE